MRWLADIPYYLKAHPATQVIVLITDDADFINLGERLKRYKMQVVVISNSHSFEKYRQFFDDVFHWKRDILSQNGTAWPGYPHGSSTARHPPSKGAVGSVWGEGTDDDDGDEGGIEGWTDVMRRDDTQDAVIYPIRHSASSSMLSRSCRSDSDSSDSNMEASEPDTSTFPRRGSNRSANHNPESSCSESGTEQPAKSDSNISRRISPNRTETYPKKLLRSTKPKHTRQSDSSSDADMDTDPDSESSSPGRAQLAYTKRLNPQTTERRSEASRRVTPGNWTNSDSDSDWSDSELQVAKIVHSKSGYSSTCSSGSRPRTTKPSCFEDEDDVDVHVKSDVDMEPLEERLEDSSSEPRGPHKALHHSSDGEAGTLTVNRHDDLSSVPSTTIPSASAASSTRGGFSLGRIASFLGRRTSDPDDSDEEWGRMYTTTRWEWNCFGNLGVSLGSKRKASDALEAHHTPTSEPLAKKPKVVVEG